MNTWKTIALLASALLVLAGAGCGASEETTTASASTTGAPQTTTTRGQTVGTTAATEQMTTITTPGTSEDGLAEEYEVYSALIQSVYKNALIIIEDTTAQPDTGLFSAPDAASFAGRQWPELGDDILSDFKTKNQTPMVLERRFTLSVRYEFISKQEIESIFSKNASGWDDFYAKYPGSQGVLTLSRVGFNEAKDTAVLYAGNQSHWVAGEGNMVLMKKMAGRWSVQAEAMMWIS